MDGVFTATSNYKTIEFENFGDKDDFTSLMANCISVDKTNLKTLVQLILARDQE